MVNRRYRRRSRFPSRRKVCAFTVAGIKRIDWKNVDTLKRYIMDNGSIRPRQKTGTSAKFQRQLATAIKRARYMALLPYTTEHSKYSGFTRR
jgi:small subunit ribosomal protein S18